MPPVVVLIAVDPSDQAEAAFNCEYHQLILVYFKQRICSLTTIIVALQPILGLLSKTSNYQSQLTAKLHVTLN